MAMPSRIRARPPRLLMRTEIVKALMLAHLVGNVTFADGHGGLLGENYVALV
jgi:prepilin-type processing-associated H-X9-DG protein